MRYRSVLEKIGLGIFAIVLLLPVEMFFSPNVEAAGEVIVLSPDEGEIGDDINIEGHGFQSSETYRVYFSSDKARKNNNIDTEVTSYQRVKAVNTDASGDFAADYSFKVPSRLTHGTVETSVHRGDYYVYVTPHLDTEILAVERFTVIGGEVEIDPEEGQVGVEIEIRGSKFGINERITVKYDGESIKVASGDEKTDEDGEFTCLVVIPKSTAGMHTLIIADESGNEPEVEFKVKPRITIKPTSGAVHDEIDISGTGFEAGRDINITVDCYRVPGRPIPIVSNAKGSFNGSFLVPHHVTTAKSIVGASDGSNFVESGLIIVAGIKLDPVTSYTTRGHVGSRVRVNGTGFLAGSEVIVSYDGIEVVTTVSDERGVFIVTFTVPTCVAGKHEVNATDGTNNLTTFFIVESDIPPRPVPVLPQVAAVEEQGLSFDWEDVIDPSGVTYHFQIGRDADFTSILLDKPELTESEYTFVGREALEPTTSYKPYYWRVRAIDCASNEGRWTYAVPFFFSAEQKTKPSESPLPGWIKWVWFGIGVLLLSIFGFWLFMRRRT